MGQERLDILMTRWQCGAGAHLPGPAPVLSTPRHVSERWISTERTPKKPVAWAGLGSWLLLADKGDVRTDITQTADLPSKLQGGVTCQSQTDNKAI